MARASRLSPKVHFCSSIPQQELLSCRERSFRQLCTGARWQRREPRLPLLRSRRRCPKPMLYNWISTSEDRPMPEVH
eukprot:207575-Pyramimonas_sp.AAC.1